MGFEARKSLGKDGRLIDQFEQAKLGDHKFIIIIIRTTMQIFHRP